MPAFSLLATRARFLVGHLNPLLPPMQLHVYTASPQVKESNPLYLFAFVSDEYLLGGYQLPPPLVSVDLDLSVLQVARFLDQAWRDAVPRFCPEELRSLYTTNTVQRQCWRRLV